MHIFILLRLNGKRSLTPQSDGLFESWWVSTPLLQVGRLHTHVCVCVKRYFSMWRHSITWFSRERESLHFYRWRKHFRSVQPKGFDPAASRSMWRGKLYSEWKAAGRMTSLGRLSDYTPNTCLASRGLKLVSPSRALSWHHHDVMRPAVSCAFCCCDRGC